MRQLFLSLLLGILIMAGTASAAICNGDYPYWFPNTNVNNEAVYFPLNSTGGIDLGDGIQRIWCLNTTNYFCYDNSTSGACFNGDTKLATFVAEGNISDYSTPDKDLLIWWHGNTTDDHSIYDIAVTNQGCSRIAAGYMGAAYDCDLGTTDYIAIADDAIYDTIPANSAMSWAIWLSVDDWNHGSDSAYIVNNEDGGYPFMVRKTSAETFISWFIDTDGADELVTTDTLPGTGSWFHLAGTLGGGSQKIFVNGNLINTNAFSGTIEPMNSIAIACRVAGDRCFSGQVKEFMLWNRTLADYEVTALFNATSPGYSTLGANASVTGPGNITISVGVAPDPLYNLTDANFSIYYNETSGLASNITLNFTVNGLNVSDENPTILVNVTADTTIYFYVEAGNYSKHDNITLAANLTTYTNLETNSSSLSREIQNTLPGTPDVTFSIPSIIIGDDFNATGSATDDDQDTLIYWYIYGYNNGSNITNWTTTALIVVNASNENETFRVHIMADDGETNGTMNVSDINVTRIAITWPGEQSEHYGTGFYFRFNFTAQAFQPCTETLGNDTYNLGNITGDQNNSRTVWYGNHIYNVSCQSLQDPARLYYHFVNFSNYYANWTISIMTENDWDVPLTITGANLSIIISCEGGETYVYNFSGTSISGVKPPCNVESVSAKVDYSTDSYLRERTPPCTGTCDLELYMVDALIYTVLQIPIYMSDYGYYDARIELYKTSGGQHYTIAEGDFDVEHKYVTYLTKDNTYLIRLTQGGAIRDIGFLYAATATSQYLSLSEINLVPDITLISDNLIMAAEFDDPTLNQSTLRIQYQDLINMTTSVRVQIFSMRNNTAWYDNTIYGSNNFTISINNVNTTRHSVHFTVEHVVLGNSPIPYTVGVGSFAGFDLGLPAEMEWLYSGFAFFIIMVTSWVITPENRLPGYLLLLAELGIFSVGTWLIFESASMALFIAFVVAGIIYEIRHKGVS